MDAQILKEELLQREAYALGYRNGASDVILSLSKKMQEKALTEKKEVPNGNN